jgi:hypothetical protein
MLVLFLKIEDFNDAVLDGASDLGADFHLDKSRANEKNDSALRTDNDSSLWLLSNTCFGRIKTQSSLYKTEVQVKDEMFDFLSNDGGLKITDSRILAHE